MNGRLEIYTTVETLIRGSAESIASLLIESVRSGGSARIALSGGSTPRSVYALFGTEPLRSTIPWASVHIFWGDERCVPPDHPESNFRMVHETLLRHIIIPSSNIHRIKGEHNPGEAARKYAEDIGRTFQLNDEHLPQFDVILLGLGEDGHTASLFPETPALQEQHKWVTEVHVQKLNASRITLTLPVINNAHHVLFLVSGKTKALILAEVVQNSSYQHPAQFVHPVSGDLRWLVDQDAASRLQAVSRQ